MLVVLAAGQLVDVFVGVGQGLLHVVHRQDEEGGVGGQRRCERVAEILEALVVNPVGVQHDDAPAGRPLDHVAGGEEDGVVQGGAAHGVEAVLHQGRLLAPTGFEIGQQADVVVEVDDGQAVLGAGVLQPAQEVDGALLDQAHLLVGAPARIDDHDDVQALSGFLKRGDGHLPAVVEHLEVVRLEPGDGEAVAGEYRHVHQHHGHAGGHRVGGLLRLLRPRVSGRGDRQRGQDRIATT